MRYYLKYGVSAVALVASINYVDAQQQRGPVGTAEQQSGSDSRGTGHVQGQPSQNSQGSQRQGHSAQNERGQAGQREGDKAEQKAQQGPAGRQQLGQKQREEEGRRGQTGEAQTGRQQSGQSETQGQGGRQRFGETGDRQGQSGREERQLFQDDRERQTGEGAENRESGGRARVAINIPPQQRTRIQEVITRDASIRKLRRSDINFSINVGTRVPDTVVFYDAPPQLISINPVFRNYKIIVLDDVILVIDPATREIVDVIEI